MKNIFLTHKDIEKFISRNFFEEEEKGNPVSDLPDTEIDMSQVFPQYNIIRRYDDSILIEVTVAGYSESDLTVEVKDNLLIVTGKKQNEVMGDRYRYKGITRNSFKRSFKINPNANINGASLVNGILTISLSPPAKLNNGSVEIPINGFMKRQLLQEQAVEGTEVPF